MKNTFKKITNHMLNKKNPEASRGNKRKIHGSLHTPLIGDWEKKTLRLHEQNHKNINIIKEEKPTIPPVNFVKKIKEEENTLIPKSQDAWAK